MTVITYRLIKGAPISAEEYDGSLHNLDDRVTTLEDTAPGPIEPVSLELTTNSLSIGWSNGSISGPVFFTMPLPRFRGDWQPATTYHELNFFRAPNGELGAVLYDHVSEATFDWALENDTSGEPVYQSISGSATGALAGMSDVVLTDPTTGDSLVFDGDNWVNATAVTVATLVDLTDVAITSEQDLDDLSYDSYEGLWVNRSHRDVIPVPYHPGAFSSDEAFFYYIFPRDGYIPANFGAVDGYQSRSGGTVNATGSTVITVSRAADGDLLDFSETVGTITIAAGEVEGTFATQSGTVKNFSAGDVLRLKAPSSADGTFAGFYATLVFITA